MAGMRREKEGEVVLAWNRHVSKWNNIKRQEHHLSRIYFLVFIHKFNHTRGTCSEGWAVGGWSGECSNIHVNNNVRLSLANFGQFKTVTSKIDGGVVEGKSVPLWLYSFPHFLACSRGEGAAPIHVAGYKCTFSCKCSCIVRKIISYTEYIWRVLPKYMHSANILL